MARGGGTKRITDLFAKYRNSLVAPEMSIRVAFVEVVKDLFGLDINIDKVKYNPSDRKIILSGPGVMKSEIKMKEKEILLHLKGRLGEKNCPKLIL